MKRTLGVLLLVLLAACSCGGAQRPSAPATRDQVAAMVARTVRIEEQCLLGGGWGSGVVVGTHPDGGTVIATAAHVPELGCISWVNGHRADLIARDAVADVALLRLPDVPTDLPELEVATPWLGMPVVSVGYPLQLATKAGQLQVTRGYVVATSGFLWRVSASFWFGASGGPTFDEDGRLVGLNDEVLVNGDAPVVDQFFVTPGPRVLELYHQLGG